MYMNAASALFFGKLRNETVVAYPKRKKRATFYFCYFKTASIPKITLPFIHTRYTMQQPRFLSNLQKGRHAQGITTRVIRKWTHYENMGQGPPLYVGMVLADARVPS